MQYMLSRGASFGTRGQDIGIDLGEGQPSENLYFLVNYSNAKPYADCFRVMLVDSIDFSDRGCPVRTGTFDVVMSWKEFKRFYLMFWEWSEKPGGVYTMSSPDHKAWRDPNNWYSDNDCPI